MIPKVALFFNSLFLFIVIKAVVSLDHCNVWFRVKVSNYFKERNRFHLHWSSNRELQLCSIHWYIIPCLSILASKLVLLWMLQSGACICCMNGTAGISFVRLLYGLHQLGRIDHQLLLPPELMKFCLQRQDQMILWLLEECALSLLLHRISFRLKKGMYKGIPFIFPYDLLHTDGAIHTC